MALRGFLETFTWKNDINDMKKHHECFTLTLYMRAHGLMTDDTGTFVKVKPSDVSELQTGTGPVTLS